MKKAFHQTARCAEIVNKNGNWAKDDTGNWFTYQDRDCLDYWENERTFFSIGELCAWLDAAYAAGLEDGRKRK